MYIDMDMRNTAQNKSKYNYNNEQLKGRFKNSDFCNRIKEFYDTIKKLACRF